MEKIILEVVKDSGKRPDYRIYDSLSVTIGRAFDNDLIIADPHVSQKHCVIKFHEQGYSLEDNQSFNGTWLIPVATDRRGNQASSDKTGSDKGTPIKSKHKRKIGEPTPIFSGDMIMVGNTRIRFIISNQEVEPAKPMAGPNVFFEEINSPVKAWLIMASAILLGCAVEHQESIKNLPVWKFVSIGFGLIFALVIWSGIWSFVGWLVKRKSFFNAHLSWGTFFFLGMTLIYPLADHLGYIFSSQMAEMAVGCMIFWIFISALIAGHLILATNISRRYQLLASVILSSAVILFGLVTYYAGRSAFNSQPDLYGTLAPPYSRIMNGDSIDQFLNNSKHIFVFKAHEQTNR